MTRTNITPEIGDIVTGRPWISGVEQVIGRRAIVLANDPTSDYLIVFYPHLGAPAGDGVAIQGLLRVKVGGWSPLAAEPKTWVATAYRLAKAANAAGMWRHWTAGIVLEREHRARRAAR